MLVLSRKAGESIKIGREITVFINRISGNRVTLAVNAPRHIGIIRGELTPFEDFEEAGSAETVQRNRTASLSFGPENEPVTRQPRLPR